MSICSRLSDHLVSAIKVFIAMVIVSSSAALTANDVIYDMNNCSQQRCAQMPCYDWSYNPSAHHKCGCNPCGGFLDNLSGRVDFLWWRPCSDGTQLGTSQIYTISGSSVESISFDKTNEKDLNFKFDPGFRLGIGYYCPSSCVDIALNWTHFHSKAKAESTWQPGIEQIEIFGVGSSVLAEPIISSDNIDVLLSDWNRNSELGLYLGNASARWTLDMDLIDLEFAQKYYVNHCFSLRPHVGLRLARIDQNYHVDQFGVASAVLDLSVDEELSFTSLGSIPVKSKNDFKGIGPRIGLDMEFHLGFGFTLYGKGAASLVYGKFERDSNLQSLFTFTETLTEGSLILTANDEEIETYLAKGSSDRCTVPMTEITFGIMWEHCLECCNRNYPFALAVAWEQNAFYDLNHFNFVPGADTIDDVTKINGYKPKTGNLMTQGLTVSAMIGF